MGYTREKIICKCEEALKDVKNFYKNKFINYRGKTSDTKEWYTEVIAEFVLNNINEFEKIPVISRETTYKTEGHDGEYDENSNRLEEITAMKLYKRCKAGHTFDKIGKIIDYQTPLKNIRDDEAGKIDLISVNKNVVYILELKREDSKETMLRCVLEGYTYLKIINKEKFLKDFELSSDCVVKASPLVFFKGKQWKEMQENRPNLIKLMQQFGCKPFYILKNDEYSIMEEK